MTDLFGPLTNGTEPAALTDPPVEVPRLRFYIAGTYADLPRLRTFADKLTGLGHEVTASWLHDDAHNPTLVFGEADEAGDAARRKYAVTKLQDIIRANGFILFGEPEAPPFGEAEAHLPADCTERHVEFGYAMAGDKAIFVIGDKENNFHYLLGDGMHYATEQAFLDTLDTIANQDVVAPA